MVKNGQKSSIFAIFCHFLTILKIFQKRKNGHFGQNVEISPSLPYIENGQNRVF